MVKGLGRINLELSTLKKEVDHIKRKTRRQRSKVSIMYISISDNIFDSAVRRQILKLILYCSPSNQKKAKVRLEAVLRQE